MDFQKSLLLLLTMLIEFAQSRYENCSSQFFHLERALYSNSQNIFYLQSAFNPPERQTPGFLHVIYKFPDIEGQGCAVTYFWSVGSIVFFLPPSVFKYSSLYFNTPAKTVANVTIELPEVCQQLVFYDNVTKHCTCKKSSMLSILTKNLLNYAKYSDPDQLQRDAQETIRVTCDTEIIHYYFGNKEISFFLAATLLIPFITTSSLSLYIRTHRETIVRKIRKGSNHRNMASLVLTGFCVMIYVVVMDVAAVITVFSNNHEYSEFELTYSLNLQLVTVIAVLDVLSAIYFVSAAWYVASDKTCCYCCLRNPSGKSCQTCFGKCSGYLYAPLFCLLFRYKKRNDIIILKDKGDTDTDEVVQTNVEGNEDYITKQVLALLCLLLGPVFVSSSHCTYIFMAWLTDPEKTSSILVIGILLFVYLFSVFRGFYKFSESHSLLAKNKVANFFKKFGHCGNCCQSNNKDLRQMEMGEDFMQNSGSSRPAPKIDIINCSSYLSTLVLGMLGILPVVLILLSFIYIAVPTLELVDYLESVIKAGLIVVGLLFSHKVLSMKEPDLNVLVNSLKRNYEEKCRSGNKLSEDAFEACGEIAGELCQSIQRGNVISTTPNNNVSNANEMYPTS